MPNPCQVSIVPPTRRAPFSIQTKPLTWVDQRLDRALLLSYTYTVAPTLRRHSRRWKRPGLSPSQMMLGNRVKSGTAMRGRCRWRPCPKSQGTFDAVMGDADGFWVRGESRLMNHTRGRWCRVSLLFSHGARWCLPMLAQPCFRGSRGLQPLGQEGVIRDAEPKGCKLVVSRSQIPVSNRKHSRDGTSMVAELPHVREDTPYTIHNMNPAVTVRWC